MEKIDFKGSGSGSVIGAGKLEDKDK